MSTGQFGLEFLSVLAGRDRRDRIALVLGDQRLTYGELIDAIADAAEALRGAGVTGGDRVVLYSRNTIEYVVTLLACWRVGAVAVPTAGWRSGRQVVEWCSVVDASCLVIDPVLLERVEPYLNTLRARTCVTSSPGRLTPIGAARGMPRSVGPAFDPELALIIQTSGTTSSRPKGICHSPRSIAARLRAHDRQMPVLPDDVSCGFACMANVMGLFVSLLPTLEKGACVVLVPDFDPLTVLREITERRATILCAGPSILSQLLAAPDDDAIDTSSLRRVWTGGDKVPARLHEDWARRFGAPLLEGYGLSETCAGVLVNPEPSDNRPGTVGKPFPTVEIRLVGEHGRDVPDGAPGEVWVKCSYLFEGYWKDPELTRQTFVDGWLKTGDEGTRDPDGRYRILGRNPRGIKRGNFFVSPLEVEEALRSHADIADVLVLPVASEVWGHELEAFLVLRRHVSADALRGYATERLDEASRPARFWTIPEIPLSAAGKVDRKGYDAVRSRAIELA